MDAQELSYAIEALLFAAAEPMGFAEIRAAVRRWLPDEKASEASQTGEASDAGDAQQADFTGPDDGGPQQTPAPAPDSDGSDAMEQGDSFAGPPGPADGVSELNAPSMVAALAAELAAAAPGEQPGPAPASFALTMPEVQADKPASLSFRLRQAISLLQERWRDADGRRGFRLVEVGGGFTFRSHPRFAPLLQASRQHKAPKLSRPALESLAIVAYRQPVTKPEIDHLRGVDSGGSLKVLLDRRLVAVMGKKEEPGRPLLYGTTDTFLSFFNLGGLTALPSLHEFEDLNDDDEEALRAFDGQKDLAGLASQASKFRIDDAVATDALDQAVASLQRTHGQMRATFLAQGLDLGHEDGLGSGDEASLKAKNEATGDADASPTQH